MTLTSPTLVAAPLRQFALPGPTGTTHQRCHAGAVEVPETIVCVDCGGTAHLISYPPPDEPWEPGDVVAYRCADCLDRWDLVVADPDDD